MESFERGKEYLYSGVKGPILFNMRTTAPAEVATLRLIFRSLMAFWTVFVVFSLLFQVYGEKERITGLALAVARISAEKDVAYRSWNASHGGVYVPVTEKTPVNPYLAGPEREVTTTSGIRLAQVNPAYMMRQAHSPDANRLGLIGHLTSLNPLRPGNAPDAWEERALRQAGARHLDDYHALEIRDGKPVLRFLKTLLTEESCLTCHARQGYALGQVRGGIALTIPMTPFLGIYRSYLIKAFATHAVFGFIGLGALIYSRRLLMEQAAERTALLQKAEASARSAENANRVKGDFLATMSHEVRTPLNGIIGLLQLQQETALDAEQREYVDLALESSRMLTVILNDILDFARLEAGKSVLTEGAVDPGEVLRSVVGVFQGELKRKGLACFLENDPGIPAVVGVDEVRLRQILLNLIGNAVKFTDAGRVTVSLGWLPAPGPGKPCGLLIIVADTGPGIPERMLEQVVLPFTQADGSTTRKYGGTGLGLAIVKRLVDQMGGGMCIDSEPGAGTTMYVCVRVTDRDRVSG